MKRRCFSVFAGIDRFLRGDLGIVDHVVLQAGPSEPTGTLQLSAGVAQPVATASII
jgi:hypothetical protein